MLLLHTTGTTKVGEVRRYTITYTPAADRVLPLPTALHLRIKNTASLPLRAAYLHGPYTIYVSVRRQEFQAWHSTTPGTAAREEELRDESDRAKEPQPELEESGIPAYDPHLKAGASFYATLPIPEDLIEDSLSSFRNSRVGSTSPTTRRAYEHGGQVSLDGTRHFGAEGKGKRKSVTWIVEIVSQVIFSRTATVGYEVLLGRDEKSLSLALPFGPGNNASPPPSAGSGAGDGGAGILSGSVKVRLQGTHELWNLPPFPSWDDPPVDTAESTRDPEEQDEAREARRKKKRQRKPKKVHLVILTHGLHSNTGADMLFMKEAIDEEERKADILRRERREADIAAGKIPVDEDDDEREQVIVRGYHDNVCHTERGIKFLGKRLAKYVLHLVNENCAPPQSVPSKLQKRRTHHHPHLTPDAIRPIDTRSDDSDTPPYKITSISFIGHSLGGLVQTYAIAFIHAYHPNFFHDIKPINFVALATPFLGLSNENPLYVKFALDFGLVGKTGQDLGLSWRAPTTLLPSTTRTKGGDNSSKPLLRILPTGPAHEVLGMFRNRTVYANVVNDGVVPLRTSCLLFLDWKALGRVEKARRQNTVGGLVEWGWGQLVTSNSLSPTRANGGLTLMSSWSRRSPTVTNKSSFENDRTEEGETRKDGPDSTVSKAPMTSEHNTRQPQSNVSSHTLPKASEKPNAFSSLMTLFRPQAGTLKKRQSDTHVPKIYHRSQTVSSTSSPTSTPSPNPNADSSDNEIHDLDSTDTDDLMAPPKTTLLEAAGDILNPPLPTTEFIIDPSSRPRTIFHDRIYHASDIPPPPTKQKRVTSTLLSPSPSSSSHTATDSNGKNAEQDTQPAELRVEEKIARAYHRGLSWRKVLVRLEPDAHNNMIVRRMFANAYGWPVVQHLVETHFGLSEAALTPDSEEENNEHAADLSIAGGQRPGHKVRHKHSESAPTLYPLSHEHTLPPQDWPQNRRRSETIETSESAQWSESALKVTDDEDDEDLYPRPSVVSQPADQGNFLGVPEGLKKPDNVHQRHRAASTAEVSRVAAEASRVRREDAVAVGLGAAGRRGETGGGAAKMLERYGGAAGAGAGAAKNH